MGGPLFLCSKRIFRMKNMDFTKMVKILISCYVGPFFGDLQKRDERNCPQCGLPCAPVEALVPWRKTIFVLRKHAELLGRQQKHQIYQKLLSFLTLFPLGTRSQTPKLPETSVISDPFPLGPLRPEASLRSSFLGQPPMADSPGRYGLVGPPSSPKPGHCDVISSARGERRALNSHHSPLPPSPARTLSCN